jgi:autotransporter-associated beta strand protein
VVCAWFEAQFGQAEKEGIVTIFRRRGLVVGLIVGLLAVFSAQRADAGTYYWDANGSTAGAGSAPSGTWQASGTNWTTDWTGGSTISAYTTQSTDDLYFVAGPGTTSGSGAYTVTVSGTNSAASLNFQASGAATFSGGTINLGGGSTPGISIPQYAYAYTSNGAVTISAAVALQAAQTWINNSSNSLSVSGNVTNGANTLTVGGAGNTNISGNIGNGAGGLVVVGPGTLTLTGTNSYAGGTTVNAGTLVVATSGALAGYNTASRVTVGNGGTLSLSIGGSGWAAGDVTAFLSANKSGFAAGSVLGMDTTLAGTGGFSYGGSNTFISGNMGLAKAGTNTLTLTGSNTFTGGTTVSAGTLQLGDGTSGHDGSLSSVGGIYNNGTLTFNLAGSQTYAGIIGGTGNLTKAGTGTLTLQVPSTFSGTTTISGGTLDLSSGVVLQQSTVLAPTASGASIVFDQSVSSGGFTFGGLTGSGNLSLQNNAASPAAVALTVGGNNGSTTYSGALSGSGSLTKAGGGTLVLSGSNTYTGGTTVGAGTLAVTTTGALPSYSSGATVAANSGATLALSVGGTAGWTAANVGSLLSANSGGFASGSVLGLDTTLAGTGGFSYGGTNTTIAGNMGLAKLGANTLILTATNTYTGPTTVSGGTLQFGDGTSSHDGSLASTAGIINNAALVYNLYGSQSYSGVISGFGSLTKAGSGVLTLQGTSTYSGPTTISGGTLQLGSGSSGQDGSLSNTSGITDNAALIYNLAGSQTYPGPITGTGNLTKSGTGTLTLSGTNNTYTGGTTISAGTLAVTTAGALAGYNSASKVRVGSGGVLALSVSGSGWSASNVDALLTNNGSGFVSGSVLGFDTTNASFPYGSAISGSMGLTKLGANTLTLSGTNTYTGGTTVSAGTLEVATTGALANYGSNSKVTVSNGGTLALSVGGTAGWTATNVGSLLSANSGGFTAGSAIGIDTTLAGTGGFSYGGSNTSIAGNMGLTKLGPNTLTLTAANTFTGPTTVSGGTLDLSNGNALQNSTLVGPTAGSLVFDSTVGTHAFTLGGLSGPGNIGLQDSGGTAVAVTVGGNGSSTTYSGILSGSGSLAKTGTGTLTLARSNTYTGGTTVTGGVLQFGDGVAGQDGSVSGAIANSAALVYNLAGSQTYSGAITGTGSLTKIGPGLLTLSGTSDTYTGGTTVGAGTLEATTAGALAGYSSASKVAVGKGGTLALSVSGSGWNASSITSLLTNNSNGFLSGSVLGFDTTNASFSYGSAIAGSMGVTTLGPNTLTLSGTNTYTGGTTVGAGTLAVPATGALAGYNTAGKVAVNSSATLALSVGGTGWTASNIGSLVSANSGGFNPGSTLSIDTTLAGTGGFSYGGSNTSLAGNMGLTQLGPNLLTLTASNTFTGPTTVSGSTLDLSNANALQRSTLIAPTGGSLVFDSTVSSHAFTFGALSGSGSINLQDSGGTAVALTVGGNNASTTYSRVLSGSGSLTKAGAGTLTLTRSNSFSGGTTINGGALIVASTGSLTSASGKNLYVGNTGPGALTIQDSASVSVGGGLDVNHQATGAWGPSTLTLTGGSLSVTGATMIGRAQVNLDPSNTSAAFYQSGGAATLSGLVTVGNAGTATSLLDISGGTMTAAAGLVIGNRGNGGLNVHGPGLLSVAGTQGLVIGQDSSQATGGALILSSGTLSVASDITLGGNGGAGTLIRSGGTLLASGGLVVGGNATLIVDNTLGALASATSFSGTLTQTGQGILTVVPYTGCLSTSEAVSFGQAPALTNGILGPWAVVTSSGTNTSADYLKTSGTSPYSLAVASYTNGFSSSGGTSVVSVTSSSSLSVSTSAYAVKFGPSTTTNLNGHTLQIISGGLILNGSSTISGGTLSLTDTGGNGLTGLIYTGGGTQSTIASPIYTNQGLVKFGPDTLVLPTDNSATLTGGTVAVESGTLSAQSAGALGAANSCAVTVAAGATLALQSTGGFTLGNTAITLNGTGAAGGGALANSGGNNALSGTITLGSNSQIDVSGGSLTLSGPVQGLNYSLTKTGGNTLVLAGSSRASFPGSVTVAAGALNLQNSNALGAGGSSVTVADAATVQLQGGATALSIPSTVPLTLSGVGTGNGALENVSASNSWAGQITLAADSTVGVDAAADTLTLSGEIDGGYSLSKTGNGTLALSCSTNGFTGGVNVLQGTLSLSSMNGAGSKGPLGAGTLPVVLGSSGQTATLSYTGGNTTSSRNFALATGGGGNFQVSGGSANLTLSGAVSGGGNLNAMGPGSLTLTGSDTYTGSTTVSGGTLTLAGSAGSLASPIITVDGNLTLSNSSGANNTNRIADNATVNLAGGTLNFSNDASANSFSETIGLLHLAADLNSTVSLSQAGSGGTSILVFNGLSRSPGATVNFTGTGLGTSTRNALTIVGQPTGFIAAWATSGNDWAKYAQIPSTSTYSVTPFVSSDYEMRDDSYWTSTYWPNGVYPKLSGGTLTLSTTADRTISSLNLATTGATTLNIPDGRTLHIDGGTNGGNVGGLLISGSYATTIAASGTNQTGKITAGMSNQPGEILVQQYATQPATISASITDNGSYPVSLVTTGPGTLILSGSNTYTGGTMVIDGLLEINNSAALPSGSVLYIGPNGSVVLGDSSLGGDAMIGGSAPFTPTGVPAYLGSSVSPQNISATPEPNTLALLGAGLVGLTVMAIRRRFSPSSQRSGGGG